MIMFGIAVAVLTVAALLIILPPLLRVREKDDVSRKGLNITVYRDQLQELDNDFASGLLNEAEYEQAKQELETSLLQDVAAPDAQVRSISAGTTSAVIIALALPMFAGLLYFQLGAPQSLGEKEISATSLQFMSAEQLKETASTLQRALLDDPEDGEKWAVLGRANLMLGEFAQSVAAFKEAEKHIEPDAQFYADLSDVTAMVNGGNMQGEPVRLLGKALRLDPSNTKALWLFGTAAFEAGDFQAALVPWRRLHDLLPVGSEDANQLAANIKQVEQMIANAEQARLSPNLARVEGVVSLSEALQEEAGPDAVFFLFATDPGGGGAPLAAMRGSVAELPLSFSLDDSMAMIPAMRLSTVSEVTLTARISKNGDAIAQSGDLQGSLTGVKVGSSDNQLLIDSRIP